MPNSKDHIIVKARNLQKTYGKRHALKGVDFEVHKGECFGFLGPNGAGKTTTIQIILGLAQKTGGDLHVFNHALPNNHKQVKQKIGVVPQNDNLDTDLTVFENLLTYASYYNIPTREAKQRAEKLLDFFALANRQQDIIWHLSGGQRRRLLLARALMHNPELLILDEPTVGLDPQARFLIWERLRELKEDGVTMMLTSHYMDEVARLSDRVLILDQGQIVAQGNPQQMIKNLVGLDVFEVTCGDKDAKLLQKVSHDCKARAELINNGIQIYTHHECAELETHIREYENWLRRPANLEDLFIQLTGRSLHES